MLYIVRHGETDWNKEKRTQGHANIPLNETGIKQAYEVKEKLKNINFDLVFCSPLDRTISTAKIITDHELIIDDRLIERNNGIFEGKLKKDNDEFKKNLINYKDEDDGVETLDKLQERANLFLKDILSKYKDKNILIVTHAGLIFNMMCYLYGPPTDDTIDKYRLDNCGVIEYTN